jgi:hypothetical protein
VLKRTYPLRPPSSTWAVGLLVGPTRADTCSTSTRFKESALLEALTEVVGVDIAVFSRRQDARSPFTLARWRAPIAAGHRVHGVDRGHGGRVRGTCCWACHWGPACCWAPSLAPTDPVLATDVQIRHPGDRDQLRFTLTCEAGMNDGSAFPFVMLGLGLLGLHGLGEWGATLGTGRGAVGHGGRRGHWRVAGGMWPWPDCELEVCAAARNQHALLDDFLGPGLDRCGLRPVRARRLPGAF